MADFTTGSALAATVQWQTAQGRPTPVDGATAWAVEPADMATVTPNGDGRTAAILVGNTVGQFTVTATADADRGDGVRQISASAVVDVIEGEAVAGVLFVGEAPVPVTA